MLKQQFTTWNVRASTQFLSVQRRDSNAKNIFFHIIGLLLILVLNQAVWCLLDMNIHSCFLHFQLLMSADLI